MGKTRREDTTVLIIGAGAAGLRTAIELAQADVDCLVLGKRDHGDAHTSWAAGGINASLGNLDEEDRWEVHAADSIREGHYVCDPEAVELLAKNAPERVCELDEWGCDFARTDDGKINQRYFGAQTYRRTCFVGDRTGAAILETLVGRAQQLDVPYRENVCITHIATDDGRACGAVGFDIDSGDYVAIGAHAVVIAAGGCTALYDRSTSRPDENTADAIGLAYRAGAHLRDMEFIQFHPTGMVQPEDRRGELVTEAVRGEGGHLFNADGDRFMEEYAPDEMELAARDVVARANATEIREGRGTDAGGVFLDISHRERDFLKERLPSVYEHFEELGIDIAEEPMQVAPTAHYAMGGVCVDFTNGKSSLEGLYAVGEATSGLHGANRLGGNSLCETVVFGQICGAHLADELSGKNSPDGLLSDDRIARYTDELDDLAVRRGEHRPQDLVADLRRLLWDKAGILRTQEELEDGLSELSQLLEKAGNLEVDGAPGSDSFQWAVNLRFMLVGAEAIFRGALMREESRGAQFREDHPDESDDWKVNTLYRRDDDGQMELWTREVPEIPEPVKEALEDDLHLDYHHLE